MLSSATLDDRATVARIAAICGDRFSADFDGADRCVALDFTDAADVAHSTVRYLGRGEKDALLREVFQLRHLRRLNLRRALLGPVPDGWQALPNLEWLDLGSNDLGTVPDGLRQARGLEYLNLGTNKLTSIPEWIGDLTRLEDLKLHKNPFHVLPEGVAGLGRLRALNLFFNRMKVLPDWFYGLTTLENLVLWNIRNLSDEIARLENLEWFTNMGCQAWRAIPEGLCALPRIRGMRLHQNRLASLPTNIGRLRTLEQLSLYQNDLSELPRSFADLDRLWRLNLGWNRFQRFPEFLATLPRLRWLGLYLNEGARDWRGRVLTTGHAVTAERPLSDFGGGTANRLIEGQCA